MVTEKVISICLCGWIKREPTSTFYPVVNADSLSTFRGEFQIQWQVIFSADRLDLTTYWKKIGRTTRLSGFSQLPVP